MIRGRSSAGLLAGCSVDLPVHACFLSDRCKINRMATYRVVLRQSEEGFSVSCPGLPGCWSQGATEEEALANIQVAIREYVEAAEELARDDESRLVEVAMI
jgi:predicted RNase H-like HicB family nuclease